MRDIRASSTPADIKAAIWEGGKPALLKSTTWYKYALHERLSMLLMPAVAADFVDKVTYFLKRGETPLDYRSLQPLRWSVDTWLGDLTPEVGEYSFRAVQVHDGADPSPAPRAAGITNPITLPVVVGNPTHSQPVAAAADGNVQLAAAGDLKCTGGKSAERGARQD